MFMVKSLIIGICVFVFNCIFFILLSMFDALWLNIYLRSGFIVYGMMASMFIFFWLLFEDKITVGDVVKILVYSSIWLFMFLLDLLNIITSKSFFNYVLYKKEE